MNKICTKCKEEKDVYEFEKRTDSIDGFRHECKICRKAYYIKNKDRIKAYYIKNKDRIKEYHKKYQKENKEKFFARQTLHRIFTNWKGDRSKYEDLFGYKLQDLNNHLSKFGDVKNKNLTIDHIIPISYLLKLIINKEDLIKWSNDLRNLMLLDIKINNKKRAKLTIEHIPYHHLFDFMCYCIDLEEYLCL